MDQYARAEALLKRIETASQELRELLGAGKLMIAELKATREACESLVNDSHADMVNAQTTAILEDFRKEVTSRADETVGVILKVYEKKLMNVVSGAHRVTATFEQQLAHYFTDLQAARNQGYQGVTGKLSAHNGKSRKESRQPNTT